SEFEIVRDLPLEAIEAAATPLVAEAIRRVRLGQVRVEPGYDGEFGVVRIFSAKERERHAGQPSLFPLEGRVGEGRRRKRSPRKRKGSASPPLPEVPRSITPHPPPNQTPGNAPRGSSPASLPPPPPSSGKGEAPLLAGLNEAQRSAVTHPGGPLLIVAGPGTGKTRTLTHRIAFLIAEAKMDPGAIVAVTFTNKAAAEMRERTALLLGQVGMPPDRLPWIGTFHALGLEILRAEHAGAGLPPDFAILDDEARFVLLQSLLPEAKPRALRSLLGVISARKARALLPQAPGEGAEAHARYEAALLSRGVVDLDDLVCRVVALFEGNGETLARYRARFRSILVDEYQDVNEAQYRLLRLLAPAGADLFAIGDPNQAIYGFRGSSAAYFLRFQEDHPTARVLHLDRNYRSSAPILDAAAQVIAGDPGALRPRLVPSSRGGSRIVVHRAPTAAAEAEFVVHTIERHLGGTSYFSIDSDRVEGTQPEGAHTFGDFAILYRTKSQADVLETAFHRSGIPYQRIDTLRFLDHPEVSAAIAALRLLRDPSRMLDLLHLLHFRNEPISAEGRRALLDRRMGKDPSEVRRTIARMPALSLTEKGAIESILAPLSGSAPAGEGVVDVLRHLVERIVAPTMPKSEGPLRRLFEIAESFGEDTDRFLTRIALREGIEEFHPDAERVTLITLHAAKGLEFPIVFLTGCEDGLIPYHPPGREIAPETLSEERRLFYVGMTRARSLLYLSYVERRAMGGGARRRSPSPFLVEISPELKEETKEKQPKAHKRYEQLSLFDEA
ncbi:MAG: ATP-dependent helicase, partial [Deltaproteobacteria bacterium]